MKEIKINIGDRISTVYIGESIRNIRRFASPENTVIITDENLQIHYSSAYSDIP